MRRPLKLIFGLIVPAILLGACEEKDTWSDRPTDILDISASVYVDEYQAAIVKTSSVYSIRDIRLKVVDKSVGSISGDYEIKVVQRYSDVAIEVSTEIGGLESGFQLEITPMTIKDFEFEITLTHEYSDGEIITQTKTLAINTRSTPYIGFSNTLPSSVQCATEVDFKLILSGSTEFFKSAEIIYTKNSGLINGNSDSVFLLTGENDLKLVLFDEGDFAFKIVIVCVDGSTRAYPICGTASAPDSTVTIVYDSIEVYNGSAYLDFWIYSKLIPQVPTWKMEIKSKPSSASDTSFLIYHYELLSKLGTSVSLKTISSANAVNSFVSFNDTVSMNNPQRSRFAIKYDSTLSVGDEVAALFTLYDKFEIAYSKEFTFTVK
ncbi:MAG: hypothetical protein SNH79_04450 [Rikenellaceae bacterium]